MFLDDSILSSFPLEVCSRTPETLVSVEKGFIVVKILARVDGRFCSVLLGECCLRGQGSAWLLDAGILLELCLASGDGELELGYALWLAESLSCADVWMGRC